MHHFGNAPLRHKIITSLKKRHFAENELRESSSTRLKNRFWIFLGKVTLFCEVTPFLSKWRFFAKWHFILSNWRIFERWKGVAIVAIYTLCRSDVSKGRYSAKWRELLLKNKKELVKFHEFFVYPEPSRFFKCSRMPKWLETCQWVELRPSNLRVLFYIV